MVKINLKYPASKIDELLTKIDTQDFNNYLLKTGGALNGRYYLGLNGEICNRLGGRILGHDGVNTTIVGNSGGVLHLQAVTLDKVRVSNGLSSYKILTEADKGLGIVPLGSDGLISSQYLPSFVDDIIELDSTNDLETTTGERGKIYVTLDTNITYRWSGTQFVEVSKSLGLGTSENEAYPGNLGATNARNIGSLTTTVGAHSTDISNLRNTVGGHTNSLSTITNTLQTVNQSIINQGSTLSTHTQQITKLEEDLDETYQLAANVDSAVQEINERTIPTLATKTEAQGYATTAKSEAITAAASDAQSKANTAESNANDYTDGAVDDLAKGQVATNTSNIASLSSNKLDKNAQAADSAKLGGYERGRFLVALKRTEATETDLNTKSSNSVIEYRPDVQSNAPSVNNSQLARFGLLLDVADGNGYSRMQLLGVQNSEQLWFRAKQSTSQNIASQWKSVAFLDSTVANAEKLGGVAAANYMQKKMSSSDIATAGWYRIAETVNPRQRGNTFRLHLKRRFNYKATEAYIFDIAIGWEGVTITQVSGSQFASAHTLIDKIRIDYPSTNAICYIDFHTITTQQETFGWQVIGDATAYSAATLVDTIVGTPYEFSTVDGMSSSHNIIAPKFIGALEGNADSASALIPKSTTVTSVDNISLTYHLVLAENGGSLPYGDNANALITIPTLAGNLKYLHQLGFTGKGLFHRKFYNKDVDSTTPWSQIAFTDSNVASATKLATPRTIWGQNFDGSGDVNGVLNITGETGYSEGIRIHTFDGLSSIWLCTTNNTGYDAGMWGITAMQGGNLRFRGGASAATDLMVITQGGNIGIGKTNPSEKLEVAGNIKASGMLTTGSDVQVGGAIDVEEGITSRGDIDASGNNIFGNLNGTISMSTATSGTALHIVGVQQTTSGKSSPFITPITITDDDMAVGGNVVITGTMTATATYHDSDERLKTFEGDVEVDLEKIKALPKKYFHWTADANGKRQLGTSAQAVEKLFPELVSTDADDHKSVNYANLSIVALAAIDKLAEQNAELVEKNAELAEQNAELERRLAKIEKLLNIE